MKLAFIKTEHVRRGIVNEIDFTPGQIQFEIKNSIIALAEPITIQLDNDGLVLDVMQNIKFFLYDGEGIDPDATLEWSLLSVITNANSAVYNELCRVVFGQKVIPFRTGRVKNGAVQPLNERSLFAQAYADELIKLVGVQ